MARVNLLTIHWGMCYGAVLQTYATCRLLEEQGHQVTVINIIHPKLRRQYLKIKSYKYIFREFLFWRFKKKYFPRLTKKAYSIDSIQLPPADVTIVGSDQVWNRDITRCFGQTFFLDFVPMSQRKVSLSSSFGKDLWEDTDEITNRIGLLLDRFDAISVREYSGVSILKNVFGLDSCLLIDPTLAYGRFKSLINTTDPCEEAFVFLLSHKESHLSIVRAISELFQVPLSHPNLFDVMFKSGPMEWLTNIFQSKLVITDSFHGTALCILFHKPFFVLCADEKKFTRIQSLLSILGLESRYIRSVDDLYLRKEEISTEIDFDIVEEILQKERSKFYSYIKTNIY